MHSLKHQKRLNNLLNIGKKHKFLKIPILILVFFELAFYHIFLKLAGNISKIVCIASLFIVFIIFGSFCSIDNSRIAVDDFNQNNGQLELGEYDVVYAANEYDVSDDIDDKEDIDDSKSSEVDYTHDTDYQGDIAEDNTMFYSADELLDNDSTDNHFIHDEALNTELAEFDKNDWKIILVNKQHPIPEDYTFELGELKSGMKCDDRVKPYLLAMIQEAKDEDINLVLCSPYRNYDRQVELFDKKIKKYMKQGYSYSESYLLTSQAVTIPGSSEHQIGLAFDIVCKGYSALNEGFADTEAGKWLKANAYKYGFILRYPDGKEDITGIEFEPWHFRYVGKDAAKYITENELTLEEFTKLIEDN